MRMNSPETRISTGFSGFIFDLGTRKVNDEDKIA